MPTITPVSVYQINNTPPMQPTFYASCSVAMGAGETLFTVQVRVYPVASPESASTHTLFADGSGNWHQTSMPYPPMTTGPYRVKFLATYSVTAQSGEVNVNGS